LKKTIDKRIKYIVHAALIAAFYTALTVFFASISFGGLQFRVSEALTVLPAITSAAIPGLFLGCVLSNAFSFMGLPDMVFGSLATLLAAIATNRISRVIEKKSIALQLVLIPLPPVVINAVVIGVMLRIIADIPFITAVLGVFAGQFGVCYFLGRHFIYW